jgi:hypothetical protein
MDIDTLNIFENSNTDQLNREYYYNINNYEESIAKKVYVIVHACMPQLLTNIKAHQQIDDYGSFNDIMNLTISRLSKIRVLNRE